MKLDLEVVKNIIQSSAGDTGTRLYNSLDNKYKDMIYQDFEDCFLANEAAEASPETSQERLSKICFDDFFKKMKTLKIDKYSSTKCRSLLLDKQFMVKITDYKTIYYIPSVSRKGLEIRPLEFMEYKTRMGVLFVLKLPEMQKTLVIHSHLIERYKLRSGIAQSYSEARSWLAKELMVSKSVMDKNDQKPEGCICRGYFYPTSYRVLASGLMLGSSYSSEDGNHSIEYYKTYLPMDMLKQDQDRIHEEVWDRIMEIVKEKRIKIPLK